MIDDIESATPALCRLQLGRALRQHREAAGLRSNQVVRRLRWSGSKLTRLEKGENATVEQDDVRALCAMYGIDERTRQTLLSYALVTKTKRDWWQSREYRSAISPSFDAFLGLEATASHLHNYESEFVPGLLQTEAYVRVIHQRAHQGLSEEQVDRLVAVRMTRQQALHRTESPLKLTAIMNEAVLRRRIGEHGLMREQLTHIAELAESLPNLRVQVVPFDAGFHTAMDGKFVVLHFPTNANVRSLIYLENLAHAWVGYEGGAISRYEEAFTDLQALAPGHRESLDMIRKASKEH